MLRVDRDASDASVPKTVIEGGRSGEARLASLRPVESTPEFGLVVATELKPVYLITGGDRPKIQRALRRLRDRIGEDATELLSAHEASGDDAVAACNSLGLLGGGGRLVIVEEVDRWKAADAKAITAYLASPAPGHRAGARRGGDEEGLGAREGLCEGGRRPRLRRSEAAPVRVGDEAVRRPRVSVDADAARLLIEVVGEDPEELASEVDKIATWSGGEPVGTREIELLAAGCAEVPGYELTDAWGRRDLAGALARLPDAARALGRPRLAHGPDADRHARRPRRPRARLPGVRRRGTDSAARPRHG